jgi:Flp pilus assembly protein TadG
MNPKRNDRGAAAVEFALVVPILVLLVIGIMEFSRLYNEQISLTNAARSAARVMAISNDQGDAIDAAIAGAPSLDPAISGGDVSFSPATCTAGAIMTVAVDYDAALITGWFGTTIALEGEGAMPCGG